MSKDVMDVSVGRTGQLDVSQAKQTNKKKKPTMLFLTGMSKTPMVTSNARLDHFANTVCCRHHSHTYSFPLSSTHPLQYAVHWKWTGMSGITILLSRKFRCSFLPFVTGLMSCASNFCSFWWWRYGVVLCLNLPRYRSCITVLSVGERMKRSQRQPPKLSIMRPARRQRPAFTAGCR